jgi:hypothetical protein
MNQLSIKRIKSNFTLVANVVWNLSCVKTNFIKICSYSLRLFICASVFMAAPARAEDANARAIVNSTQLLNLLGGVDDEFRVYLLRAIQDGGVVRAEPSFPVWIISSDTGNLLYYQGQKEFVGQAANRLVDDTGFRFGQRAFEMARSSRSTWVKVVLGGKEFRGYCAAKAPFVVCSLIP